MAERFVKVPWSLASDATLSLQARAAYPVILHLAYKQGRRKDEDAVTLTLSDIAEALGTTQNSARGAVTQLREKGWVETVRKTRTAPTSYRVKSTLVETQSRAVAKLNSGPSTRARSLPYEVLDDMSSTYLSAVPELLLVEVPGEARRQNLAFNALREECRMAEGSQRSKEIATALNGSGARGGVPVGIREQYWRALMARDDAESIVQAVVNDPERFERGLAEAIRQRAAAYRIAMPGALLTPLALAKWWADVAVMVQTRDSSDLASRMLNEANRLRQEGR